MVVISRYKQRPFVLIVKVGDQSFICQFHQHVDGLFCLVRIIPLSPSIIGGVVA
jgi:hypothetical protein